MKKILVLFLAIIVVSAMLVSCSADKTEKENESESQKETMANLEDYDTEFGFETDENGEEVAVVYEKDKNGKTVAIKLDKNGEKVTNKKGKPVTVKTDHELDTTKRDNIVDPADKPTEGNLDKITTTEKPKDTTTKINKDTPLTSQADTTKYSGTEVVPLTSDSGETVTFSAEDQNIIKSMLEVPYLYLDNYENSDGVPISIACHTAVWMAEHDGNIRTTYPSSPIVLNLFKFYGQTVVNFKTQCNEFAANAKAPIKYHKNNDTFEISEFTSKKQTVSITKIEDLGGNNFYKVTGDVSGCGKKKVVAVIQKNKLEATLGFSIKALKWS